MMQVDKILKRGDLFIRNTREVTFLSFFIFTLNIPTKKIKHNTNRLFIYQCKYNQHPNHVNVSTEKEEIQKIYIYYMFTYSFNS